VATYEPARVTTHVALADHRVTTEKLLRYPITGGGALVIDGEAIELRDAKDHRVRTLAWPGKTHRLARIAVGDDGTVAGFVATLDADSHRLEPGKLLDWWDPTGKPHEIALAEAGNNLWVRGKQIFILADGMQTLDTATAILTAHPEVPSSQQYAISPSGDRVAFTSGVVVLGQRQPSWQGLHTGLGYSSVASVAFDPTGRALAFGSNDPTALVDAATGHIVARFGQALDLLRPEFLDDKTLVTRHADYISMWDLTTGALDPARTRAVRAEHAAAVGGDLFVARTSERRPYDCSAIYLDRWTKGVPPADLDEAVDAEAPSYTRVTDQPPAIPRGAARVPFCPSQYTQFRDLDLAHLRGLQSTSGKPYRWTDLDGKHETVLAGSDMLDTIDSRVARDGTLASLVGDKLLMWTPNGAQSELALPSLPTTCRSSSGRRRSRSTRRGWPSATASTSCSPRVPRSRARRSSSSTRSPRASASRARACSCASTTARCAATPWTGPSRRARHCHTPTAAFSGRRRLTASASSSQTATGRSSCGTPSRCARSRRSSRLTTASGPR
jgi:hypothetical protein